MTFGRMLFFLLKLCLIAALVIWVADRPGTVTIDWLHYRVDLPVGIAIAAFLLLAVVFLAFARLLRMLRHAPRNVSAYRLSRRREKGLRALTRGLMAAAAGNAKEAKHLAYSAHKLLDAPSLTLLLGAQAAQLGGDDATAERYFQALSESQEGALLGLRGLALSALKRGDKEMALRFAERALKAYPKAPWAAETAHGLQMKLARFDAAEESLRAWARSGGLSQAQAQHRRAVLLSEKARLHLMPDHPHADPGAVSAQTALAAAREAVKRAPYFVPARVILARLLIAEDEGRKAARLVEQIWDDTPHPQLAEIFAAAEPRERPLDRARRFARLLRQYPDHCESHRAAAGIALSAGLWGDARRHLERLVEIERAGDGLQRSTCRLMARLEEGERADTAAARRWLDEPALPDPAWVCRQCGGLGEAGPASGHWQAVCPHCGALDSFLWKRPAWMSAPAQDFLPLPGQTTAERDFSEETSSELPGQESPGQRGSSVDAARLIN